MDMLFLGKLPSTNKFFQETFPLEMRVEHLLKLFEALLRGQPQFLFECRHIASGLIRSVPCGPGIRRTNVRFLL